MSATDPLLQPFQLKHLTLKNRILSTSHAPAYAEDGRPKLQYQLYHEEKAKGGIGMTMFGGSSTIDVDSPASFGQLYVGDDGIIPYFRQMADRIHPYGTALMCQITHMGRRTMWDLEHWLPTIAPSAVREHAHRSFPKAMELFDIERIIKAYGAAARRCRYGGLDGVEISAQTPHLLDSFWTPAVNKRSDQYGGSLENRMRFSLEVIREIRKQVGDDYIVGIRMSGDEMLKGGLTHQDAIQIVRALTATGMLDFFNVTKGNGVTEEALSHMIPNMGTPSAPYLNIAAAIKAETDLPVFHAGRMADLATARYAVREGLVDLVGMTRAHIADPHIVAKLERGQEEQIRPCVGAGYCIDRIYVGGQAVCIHNPSTGREATLPHLTSKAQGEPRKVVIVGAGPAGLEAARVSAERGHQVVLFEANSKPGGQIQVASRVERRRDLIGIVDWLYDQIQRLAVDIRLNHYATADDVMAEQPDVVIIATGGEPNTTFLEEGADLVLTTWDVLAGHATPAADVLLFDDHGRYQGVSCAEFVAKKGGKLELVTPDRMTAFDIGGTNYPAYLRTFYKHDVKITPDHHLTRVRRQGHQLVATLFNEYSNRTVERLVDQVIVEHGTLPIDDLYFELKEASSNQGETDLKALIAGEPQTVLNNPQGTYQLFRVGDAVACRNIHAAIYDSRRLCKDL